VAAALSPSGRHGESFDTLLLADESPTSGSQRTQMRLSRHVPRRTDKQPPCHPYNDGKLLSQRCE